MARNTIRSSIEWEWPTRRTELTDGPAVLLSAAEVQAVADTDPIALRMLLSPDYDGIATSFARLLMKVVQRCKRVGQVDGRVLHACKALGVCQGKSVPAVVLAKRIRGFRLAWHSFTSEECEAFVEQELDADEDGRVTAQDIFTFLRAQWVASSTRSSCPGALEGGSHRHTHRRRQTPQQAGLVATRKLPRGLQAKLLTAAGKARSYGMNVLKALQDSSPPRRVGDEAARRFLRLIGVEFGSSAILETGAHDFNAVREPHRFGEDVFFSRKKKELPRGRSTFAPASRQQGWADGAGEHNLHDTKTVPWAEPRPTARGQFPTGNSHTQDAQRHGQENRSNSPECPKLPSKSNWVVQGEGFPTYHSKDAYNAGEGGTDSNNVGGSWQARPRNTSTITTTNINDSNNDTCTSKRLRRAAEDLHRMQADFIALQAQIRGERGDDPKTPPATNAQTKSDRTGAAVEARPRPQVASFSLYDRPGSFRHGHGNLRSDHIHYFKNRPPTLTGFQGGCREGGEASGDEYRTRSPSQPLSPPKTRPLASDTRRWRALLLMAAQGKSSREETFDRATAHNGFSGIQPCECGLGEEPKACRTPKPRGRCCSPSAIKEPTRKAAGFGRGRASQGFRDAGVAATGSDEGFPRHTRPGLHPFLGCGEERRSAGGCWGLAAEEEGARRDRRDGTPERRPSRPKAIKSPMYARRGRSEERNVWDKRSGRWARPRPTSAAGVRGRSVDNIRARH